MGNWSLLCISTWTSRLSFRHFFFLARNQLTFDKRNVVELIHRLVKRHEILIFERKLSYLEDKKNHLTWPQIHLGTIITFVIFNLYIKESSEKIEQNIHLNEKKYIANSRHGWKLRTLGAIQLGVPEIVCSIHLPKRYQKDLKNIISRFYYLIRDSHRC